MRVLLASLLFFAMSWPAQARHHHQLHERHHAVVAHPAGCPRRSFCGCGVAKYVFGAPIRSLWLARNWFRFPRAAPGDGMVAVRPHHVFAIIRNLGGGRVLAYDPNSGGHMTRIHERSLRGYAVVNPHGRRT